MTMHGCHAVLSESCNYFVIQSTAFYMDSLSGQGDTECAVHVCIAAYCSRELFEPVSYPVYVVSIIYESLDHTCKKYCHLIGHRQVSIPIKNLVAIFIKNLVLLIG